VHRDVRQVRHATVPPVDRVAQMTRLCVASDLGCMLLIPIVPPGPLGHPPEGMKQARL